MSNNNIFDSATSLAARLKKQRDNWSNAFCQTLHESEYIQNKNNFNAEAALPIIAAFQVVHTMSFIHMHKYITEDQSKDFIVTLAESLYGSVNESWMNYVKQYQSNQQIELSEQLCRFCEDVSAAILEAPPGMIYGPAFSPMAYEFIYRNWGITADHFGDRETVHEYAEAVNAIHKKNK